MKINGCCNVNKHRDIKGSDKYVILYILLKFGSMERIKITFSERKDNLGISGKVLITSLGLKAKARPKNTQKGKVCHRKCQSEGLYKNIGDFDKLLYKSYESRRTNHDPTDS